MLGGMKLTNAMVMMLVRLERQERAATDYPGAYSPGLWIGTVGAHRATCEALLRRGVAAEIDAPEGFRAFTINDAGRVAIRDAGALLFPGAP